MQASVRFNTGGHKNNKINNKMKKNKNKNKPRRHIKIVRFNTGGHKNNKINNKMNQKIKIRINLGAISKLQALETRYGQYVEW
jgi:hypothetical protein